MKCPRCDNEGGDLLAISRRDNETAICHQCSEEEALSDAGYQKYDIEKELRLLENMKGTALLKAGPGGRILAYPTKWLESLEKMQEAVGGYIEIVPVGHRKSLILNEEGKLKGLMPNELATMLWVRKWGPDDIIVGDVIVTASKNIR